MIETPHIKANKDDIAKIVLMPGDPLRAKFIAEAYFEDYKLVNTVRNMLAYTGYYKGIKLTVFSSGMGMPSMGIYCYELYKNFDVEYILRIGSCGSSNKDIKLLDVILSSVASTESTFAYSYNEEDIKEIESDKYMNDIIIETAKENNLNLKVGKTLCSDVFDPYVPNHEAFLNRLESDVIASEMEAFALFYMAKHLNKKASCLLTVSDSKYDNAAISSEQRQLGLIKMIELALDSVIKFESEVK